MKRLKKRGRNGRTLGYKPNMCLSNQHCFRCGTRLYITKYHNLWCDRCRDMRGKHTDNFTFRKVIP